MIGLLAIFFVLAGELILASIRARRQPFGLDNGSTAGLGLGLFLFGLLTGLANLDSIFSWIAIGLVIVNLVFFVYGLAQFVRKGDLKPPELDLESIRHAFQEKHSEDIELIEELGAAFEFIGRSEETNQRTRLGEKNCVLRLEKAPNEKLLPDRAIFGGFMLKSGYAREVFLPRRLSWTFFSLELNDRLFLSVQASAWEFTPVGGFISILWALPTQSIFVIGLAAYKGYFSKYSVQVNLVYSMECDSECEARAYYVSGKLSARDGPLVAEIGPKGATSGNDVTADPQMQCVFGNNWSYGGNFGGKGDIFSAALRVSYTPSELASGLEPLGSYHWKCVPLSTSI